MKYVRMCCREGMNFLPLKWLLNWLLHYGSLLELEMLHCEEEFFFPTLTFMDKLAIMTTTPVVIWRTRNTVFMANMRYMSLVTHH